MGTLWGQNWKLITGKALMLEPGQVVGDVRECDLAHTSRVAGRLGRVGGEGSLLPFEIPTAGPPQLCCGLWLFIPM